MRYIVSIILLPVSWLIFFASFIFPREKRRAVFGVHTNSFSGNIKALLIEPNDDLKRVLISSHLKVINEARKVGVTAHHKYSIKGIISCIRADLYIYSSYPSDINFWLSGGAKKINVWHGTPIKKIERDISTGKYRSRYKWQAIYRLIAPYLYVKPDKILAASQYEIDCFKTAFGVNDNSFIRGFPPRLIPVYESRIKPQSSLKILYTPTWRDDHSFIIQDYLNFNEIKTVLENKNGHLLIKSHPSDKANINLESEGRIRILNKDDDVYDHLSTASILISDYSSMIFEALYLKIPVILFNPDLVAYQSNSRTFYIDAKNVIGLPLATNHNELLELISISDSLLARQAKIPEYYYPFPFNKNMTKYMLKSLTLSS